MSFQAIDRSILKTILFEYNSKKNMKIHEEEKLGNNELKRALSRTLCAYFETLQMNMEKSISNYLSRSMAIIYSGFMVKSWTISPC